MTDRNGWADQVRRILVISHNELNRRVLSQVLLKGGHVAPEAIDCSDGTDVLERRFSGPPPDLLLLDAGLPGQDPAALVRAIRAREVDEGPPGVPILSLTADMTDEFRRRLIEAGTDLFLVKPLSSIDALAAVRTLVAREARPLQRILVVDDNGLNVRVARHILERSLPGLEVEGLTDPRAGLIRCLADPRIDLLIVNGSMPGLSGPELVRELRAMEARDSALPIQIIIESADWTYLDRALKEGADLACNLPWDAVELLVSIRALFPTAPLVMPTRRP
jgi:CheY-like chemotaxis protein